MSTEIENVPVRRIPSSSSYHDEKDLRSTPTEEKETKLDMELMDDHDV